MAEDMKVLDVRDITPRERHSLIFTTLDELAEHEALLLINDHDPKPLYYQLAAEHPGAFDWEYQATGPDVWKVSIRRNCC